MAGSSRDGQERHSTSLLTLPATILVTLELCSRTQGSLTVALHILPGPLNLVCLTPDCPQHADQGCIGYNVFLPTFKCSIGIESM